MRMIALKLLVLLLCLSACALSSAEQSPIPVTYDGYVSWAKNQPNFSNMKYVDKNNMAFARLTYDSVVRKIYELQMQVNDDNSTEIIELIDEFQKLKDSTYEYAYTHEKELFRKKTGRVFYLDESRTEPGKEKEWPQPIILNSFWKPFPQFVYSITYLVAFQ
jgi:hypothetical protein